MAKIYYTNPDGTVGSMDASYDQTGRLMPYGYTTSSYELKYDGSSSYLNKSNNNKKRTNR